MEGHVPGVAGERWPSDHSAEDWGLEAAAGRDDEEGQTLGGGLGNNEAVRPVLGKG